MNENLNLAEILKDAPKGTKLWSPICGDCWLNRIDTDTAFPIKCKTEGCQEARVRITFTARGEYIDGYANCECVLFPSKDNHDWSTFEIHKHKEFKPYQRVLVREWCDCKSIWTASLYSHYDDTLDRHCLLGSEHVEDNEILPYEGNEDKLGKTVK